MKDNSLLEKEYQGLIDNERDAQTKLKEIDSALSEADRTKRSLESEYQLAKSKFNEVEGQLAEVMKVKEVRSVDYVTLLTLTRCY